MVKQMSKDYLHETAFPITHVNAFKDPAAKEVLNNLDINQLLSFMIQDLNNGPMRSVARIAERLTL